MIDKVMFEVLRHSFMSVVDEMSLMIEKVAHSLVVSAGRDFSTAICLPEGALVAEGNIDQPSHVGTLPATVRGTVEWLGLENLHPGDVIIMNDPFIGGSHCQDVRTVKPVFWNDELICFVVNSAHWSDAGGPVPGSFNARVRDSYGEALHISPVHLVRQGEMDKGVLNFILRNIRVPELTRGDIMGQLAAVDLGEKRLHELLERHGRDLIVNQMHDLIRHSEALVRAELAKLPDGVFEFTDYVDFDPLGDPDKPVPVALRLTIDGDRAIFDFSESGAQAAGAINSPRSMTLSACAVSVKAIFPHIPQNGGILNAIEMIIPEDCVLNAKFPAPVNGTFATTYEKVVGSVFGCFMQVVPERCMVGSGNITNFVIGGHDPRPGFGRDFVLYVWREAGYGARPGKKDNHTAMSLYSSGTRNEPVELMERMFPVRSLRYSFLPDSGGAGKHRGGLGVARDIILTHGDGKLTALGDRAKVPAWGFGGGHSGGATALRLDPGSSREQDIGVMATDVQVVGDQEIEFWAGGGGGWGDPAERPASWVLDDVIDEFVSVEAAENVYRVVVRPDQNVPYGYSIDEEATAKLRG